MTDLINLDVILGLLLGLAIMWGRRNAAADDWRRAYQRLEILRRQDRQALGTLVEQRDWMKKQLADAEFRCTVKDRVDEELARLGGRRTP
jgi:hypothetical protein